MPRKAYLAKEILAISGTLSQVACTNVEGTGAFHEAIEVDKIFNALLSEFRNGFIGWKQLEILNERTLFHKV